MEGSLATEPFVEKPVLWIILNELGIKLIRISLPAFDIFHCSKVWVAMHLCT